MNRRLPGFNFFHSVSWSWASCPKAQMKKLTEIAKKIHEEGLRIRDTKIHRNF